MKKHFQIILMTFLFIVFVSFNITFANAQSQEQSTVFAVSETIKIALNLIEEKINSDNFDDAEKLSKFTSETYGKNLQSFRIIDSTKSDEIHIQILDIHSNIVSKSPKNKILDEVHSVEKLFDEYNVKDINQQTVISTMLSFADEQYQIANQKNVEIYYILSERLIDKSYSIFQSNSLFNERLTSEIDSFFTELKQLVQNRSNFVAIGNIINAIQRDVLGSESSIFSDVNLYDEIKKNYEKLNLALDSGDYKTAEELGIDAYLEKFEYLEADIEVVDSKLLYTLEIDMRENLRDMIQKQSDPNDIKSFIQNTILPNLDKAEKLVNAHKSSTVEAQAELHKDLKKMGDASEDQKTIVRNEIDVIREKLQSVLEFYEKGDYQSAYAASRSAYLDSYEFVEIPLRVINPDFTLEVEFQFAELRKQISEQSDIENIRQTTIAIKRNLDESERMVTGTGVLAPSIAFSSSFAIIFREGLESVLILGSIITYLEASRNNRFKPFVYYGVLLAIAATAVTWLIASYIIDISGTSRELIEAVAALSATAVLFYVSFWILNKIEHKKWMEFVKAKVWQATTTGGVMVFVMLSFFTVYREGFETVLFYQAMFGFAKYMEMYVGLGFVLGIVSLLGVYYGMKRIGKKLPLRILFGLTMGIGAYLSIAFLGNAIRELQILDIVSYTGMIGIIPRLDINLAKMTGIHPTLETLIGQLVLLGVYLFASSYVLIVKPRKERQIAAMRKSRKVADE